jgi:acyl dehydratase
MARIEGELQFSQTRIDAYGRANGDAERLHYDAAYARARGFRGTIAHGTMIAAPLFDLALRRHGARFLSGGSLSLKWTAPVCAGDTVRMALDEAGTLEAVIQTLPGAPTAVRGTTSCGGQET